MKIKKSSLEQIAGFKSQYPDEGKLEFAFAGRSNVGKSSLINSLLDRKNLARTSSKPGKTRTINFYLVNEEFRLVDLPGYGYAAVSQNEREAWAKMINDYLLDRKNLREIFLVIDARHEPSSLDLQMYDWLIDAGFRGYIIATKADKLSNNKLNASLRLIAKKFSVEKEAIIAYSSTDKKNKEKILELIENLIED